MIRAVKNNELLKVLADRQIIFETLKPKDLDDEQLEHYNNFLSKYEKLNQLEKDVWYIVTIKGVTKTAELMQCSTSLIFKKMKKIREKLGI